MEDELKVNTKLYGFDGIIGRRDYFLNGIIIASLVLLFVLPYQVWMYANIGTLSDIFDLHKLFLKAPFLLKLWFLSGTLATFVLTASNVWRRLNDINGKVINELNGFIAVLFFLGSLSITFPLGLCILFFFVNLIAGLILLFKPGKITGAYPYDYTKDFNWGAFLGTWIWGLFNKSFKTLWMILLGLTPWSIYYQLYCGLKGNEWAFKNKKWNDVEAFNKSQQKQGIIFAVLFLIVIPVLWFLFVFGIVSIIMFAAIGDIKDNPQKAEQRMEKIENGLNSFASIYFERSEITPSENKYYVKSSDWNGYTFKEKKDIIDLAASTASTERRREYKKQHPNGNKYFSKTEELPRTKIYSVESNKLLGEYYLDESAYESDSVKEMIRAGMNAYRFYNDKSK